MKKALGILIAISIILLIHIKIKRPTNVRDWDPEFAVQANIEQEGPVYSFTDIRNWKYSSDQILSRDYSRETFDPKHITNVWFLVEPFGNWDGIAHTYFTFDFTDRDPLSFSVEARRDKYEEYSGLKGVFREYELIYQWGTETDLLVRRAVYLGNNVYMYPLQIPEDWKQNLFAELVEKTQYLNENPQFYNTLTSNCTNTLADIVNGIRPKTIPWHYSRMLTGFSDEYLAKLGYIPSDKDTYNVTDFVMSNYLEEDFSERLRGHLLN